MHKGTFAWNWYLLKRMMLCKIAHTLRSIMINHVFSWNPILEKKSLRKIRESKNILTVHISKWVLDPNIFSFPLMIKHFAWESPCLHRFERYRNGNYDVSKYSFEMFSQVLTLEITISSCLHDPSSLNPSRVFPVAWILPLTPCAASSFPLVSTQMTSSNWIFLRKKLITRLFQCVFHATRMH